MLRDFLNGSREVASRVVALMAGILFGLIGSDDACRLVITLTSLFQLDILLITVQRLINFSHIHYHILFRRWVMLLSSCCRLAIAKAAPVFLIMEGFHFMHFSLEARLIWDSYLWLLSIFEVIGGLMI